MTEYLAENGLNNRGLLILLKGNPEVGSSGIEWWLDSIMQRPGSIRLSFTFAWEGGFHVRRSFSEAPSGLFTSY